MGSIPAGDVFFSRGELSFLCFSLGTENPASLFVEPTKEKVHPTILLDLQTLLFVEFHTE